MKSNKTFDVEITEIHQIKDTVEAISKEEALEKVKERYINDEYLFGKGSFVAAEFEIREEEVWIKLIL